MSLRKKTGNLAAIFSLLVALIAANPSPASATDSLGGHLPGAERSLSLGVSADLDYTCLTDSAGYYLETQGWIVEPTLPAGLSYDATTHHISGTPTETGQFGLSDMVCDVFDAATGHIMSSVQFQGGSITVSDPNPPPPTNVAPAASIILESLNNDGCEFAMTLFFPQGSDEGSVIAKFSAGTSFVILHGLELNQVSHWRANPSSIEYLANEYEEDWAYTGERGGNNPGCGDWMTVTVDYTVGGSLAETATATVKPTRSSTEADGNLYAAEGKCWLEYDYKIQQQAFGYENLDSPTLIQIQSVGGSGELTITVPETEVGDTGQFVFNLTDQAVDAARINGWLQDPLGFDLHHSGEFNCGEGLIIGLLMVTERDANPWPVKIIDLDGLIPCGKGTFSGPGLGFQDGEVCQDAPVGTYVDKVRALTATACPTGMTTEFAGAASKGDCFKPKKPTMAKIKVPKSAKFGSSLTLSGKTDQGTILNFSASGACKLVPIQSGVNRNFKVTMNKKPGTCKLTALAKPSGRFSGLTNVFLVKVTKTGK